MKIFLSAVSDEFRDCRRALASDLRAKGYAVDVQEDFTQHPSTLLKKLEEKVDRCDRVILVVGAGFGYEPPEAARPAGQPRRSYTQWEYAFAMGERLDGSRAGPKGLYVYFADDAFVPARPIEQGSEESALQGALREEIRTSGKDRGKFGSLHELCRLVLRDLPAPDGPHHKPVNLPDHSIGSLFKGRDAFLDDLRQRFEGPDGLARAIVAAKAVHGLGGVGKTRAAIEYAWRFRDDYTALLFLSAPSAGELRACLADLVGVLAIDTEETAVELRLAEVLGWLADHPGWLLIVDNVDTEDSAREVQKLLASLTAGHVLITSRIAKWRAGVEPLDLHLLPEADAVAFLLERTTGRRRKPDDTGADAAIARELDGLALALEQAGAYVNTQHLSLAEYRLSWESKRAAVLGWHDELAMGYPASVAVTWVTTFDRLGEPERALLRMLSWLAPDPIPLALFGVASLAEAIADPRGALAALSGYSLARFSADGDLIEVHRLVQEITRNRTPDADRDRAVRLALATVDDLDPGRSWDVRAWEVWTPLSPHVEAITRHAESLRIAEPTARLMDGLASYLNARVRHAEAEPLFRRALAITERAYGPDHPDVAIRLNNLAVLLRATGRHAEAEPLFRRALAILAGFERATGFEHPKFRVVVENYGGLLGGRGMTTEQIAGAIEALGRTTRDDHP